MFLRGGARKEEIPTGYARDELVRMAPADLMVEHDGVSFRKVLAPLLDGSQPHILLETKFRRRDPSTVSVDVSLQLIRLGADRIVAIARDITERKHTQLERELLYVSRITAGRLRLQLEELELSAVIRDVVGRLGEEARRAQSDIVVCAATDVVGMWDRIRLEQVVTNLITNAFKFGGGKPIEITVEERGPIGRLVVVDHGIGIAPEDVDRIFQRYEQAVSSRAFGGLGLGLYIARQIIEAHGGTIRVESQHGAGSTFTVDLPRRAATTEEGPECRERFDTDLNSGEKETRWRSAS